LGAKENKIVNKTFNLIIFCVIVVYNIIGIIRARGTSCNEVVGFIKITPNSMKKVDKNIEI